MTLQLQRPSPRAKVVTPDGRPTSEFYRLLDTVLAQVETDSVRQDTQLALLRSLIEAQQVTTEQAVAAQAAADAASGGTAVQASGTGNGFLAGTDWVNVCQVGLTGVAAGDLTVTGTTLRSADGEASGFWRVVEGSDEVWPATAFFTASEGSGFVAMFTTLAGSAVVPRTTTGAVTYTLQARLNDPGLVTVSGYLYARRS